MLVESTAVAQLAATYNKFPYFSNVIQWTAPGYLRAAAHLYGLEAPPVAQARVLELGCAAGGNSLPTAFLYPEAQVLAVDIATEQVAVGQRIIQQAGLKNLHMKAMCLSQLQPSDGPFDYIIAHGVLSWTPPDLHEKLFERCAQLLQPQGVAYISYNCYPGWKLHEVIRDSMLFHAEQTGHKAGPVAAARQMAEFLANGKSTGKATQVAAQTLARRIPTHDENDYYLAHEYLELHNHPYYLYEVAAFALRHGLYHVGEVDVRHDMPTFYGIDVGVLQVGHQASAQHGRHTHQQYLDFAIGRSFRRSLFVPRKRAEAVAHTPLLKRLVDLQFAGWFELLSTRADGSRSYRSFEQEIHVQTPAVQALVEFLHQCWPRSVSGRDLSVYAAQQGWPAQASLEALFMSVPVMINRSYEDLPPCLQDLHTGLIPGVADIMEDRHENQSQISDFNAWYQCSTASYSEEERLVIQCLAKGFSGQEAARRLHQARLQCAKMATSVASLASQDAAHNFVADVIATLKKYALYIE